MKIGGNLKKILFITGTRADFGKLRTLMEKTDSSCEFECHIFVTGMHTISRYGSTIHEIEKFGFKNLFPYINQIANDTSNMDIILANTIKGLGHYIRELNPDMIVVHGDRIEALAGAIVGSLNNILVSHIEGGELSGTIDDLIRHSISKLAHLHFVANDEARKRLIQMGEIEKSVFIIGSPDIDVMLSETLPSISEAKKRYDIDFDEYYLFCYHPVTTELSKLKSNIEEVVEALIASGKKFVVIYPNNDHGSEIILDMISPLSNNLKFKLFPSIRFEHYLTLLKNAKAIIGNSSAGIREAPVYGTPTVNIGTRQQNRFNYQSIINVPENKESILKLLSNIPESSPPSLHFGKGNSSLLFYEILSRKEIWNTPCQKQFQDICSNPLK